MTNNEGMIKPEFRTRVQDRFNGSTPAKPSVQSVVKTNPSAFVAANALQHSCQFVFIFAKGRIRPTADVVSDSYGLAKPISIGAPGFCVFTITALSGCTSMSLYVRFPSAVARGNSWSLRTSNSRRPPQV